MTGPELDNDLDVVLPRQRPPSEPRSITDHRRRARRGDDIAKLVLAVFAVLALVGVVGLVVAGLVLSIVG